MGTRKTEPDGPLWLFASFDWEWNVLEVTCEGQRGVELAIIGGKPKMRMLDAAIDDPGKASAYAKRLKRALQDGPRVGRRRGIKSRQNVTGVEIRSSQAVRVDRLPPTARNRPM
jgi:hypothetical protein